MTSRVVVGQAQISGRSHRKWFIGHMLSPYGLRQSNVEIKWDESKAGDGRQVSTAHRKAWTLTLLVSGRVFVIAGERGVVLKKPGQFIIIPPRVKHSWKSMTDAVSLCIRWPSTPNDSYEVR